MRTYTDNFNTQLLAGHSKPYLVLEIEWGSPPSFGAFHGTQIGTYFYLDREQDSFETLDSDRFPDPIANKVAAALVVDWGVQTLTLKEDQVSAIDSITIKIEDRNGQLTTFLGGQLEQQNKTVKIWRMFDDPSVLWSRDKALMFEGITKPHTYNEADNTITFQVDDPSRQVIGTLQCLATQDVFPLIQSEYQDRNVPTVWGIANRVEGVLIQQPWQTRTIGSVRAFGATGQIVDIQDHPRDLKIPIGAGNASQPIVVYMGSDDATRTVTVKFHQSSTPATSPSWIEFVATPDFQVATATIGSVVPIGGSKEAIIPYGNVGSPHSLDLDSVVAVNSYCQVHQGSVWQDATIKSIAKDTGILSYRVTFNELAIGQALAAGQGIVFTDLTSDNSTFEAGTFITPRSGSYIYAVNSLPSKQVFKVEGWGFVSDPSGAGAEDFIIIGDQSFTLIEDGSLGVVKVTSTAWTVNLNDHTWNLGTGAINDLGRNITTVTFKGPPRFYSLPLTSNRIWVTLQGVEDRGDSTGAPIDSPPLVILEYLTNPHLCNLVTGLVNVASFHAAATATTHINAWRTLEMATVYAGFAQIEARDGLELLQDIARQVHCVLFFDQGKVSILPLTNYIQNWVATFDETCIESRSLTIAETDAYEAKTRLTANWTYEFDDKKPKRKVVALNQNALDILGLNQGEIDLDLYSDRVQVQNELAFKLMRLSRIFREVSFTAFHKALVLQPGDWIQLGYTEIDTRVIIPAGTRCEVLEVSDQPPSGRVKVKCRYVQFQY